MKENQNELIIKNASFKLSKEQQKFNTLIKKIEVIEKQLIEIKESVAVLNAIVQETVLPIIQLQAKKKYKLAVTLAETCEQVKLSKSKKEIVVDAILNLCSQSFETIEPTQEQSEFYSRFNGISYEEEQQDFYESMMYFQAKLFARIDVDIDKYEKTEEGLLNFHKDAYEKIKQLENSQNAQVKKPTKKQLAAEIAAKNAEAFRYKSLRSIYIGLAKLLHPDAETDVQLKLEKEELMKQVVVAYEAKDIVSLLRLENKWLHQQSTRLQLLEADTLKSYIHFLQERYDALQDELAAQFQELTLPIIGRYVNISVDEAPKKIKKEIIKPLNENVRKIDDFIAILNNSSNTLLKKVIVDIAQCFLATG